MRPRASIAWLLALLLLGTGIWLGNPWKSADLISSPAPAMVTPPEATSPEKAVSEPASVGLSPDERSQIRGGFPLAAELNARENTPERDLEILRELLFSFTTTLKIAYLPPLGDNMDITAALMGRNRRNLVVIPPSHPAVDAKGRLLDRWGVPYHFHPRSSDSFDLRSAGPDKALFTPDDISWSPTVARQR